MRVPGFSIVTNPKGAVLKNIKRRVRTLQTLVNASRKIADPAIRSSIIDDFDELERCLQVKPDRRRRMLNTLHAARGLEGVLVEVMSHHSIVVPNSKKSLGSYLIAVANSAPPLIPQRVRADCQSHVVRLRNRVAHNTGYYPPGNLDVDRALIQVEACLALILI